LNDFGKYYTVIGNKIFRYDDVPSGLGNGTEILHDIPRTEATTNRTVILDIAVSNDYIFIAVNNNLDSEYEVHRYKISEDGTLTDGTTVAAEIVNYTDMRIAADADHLFVTLKFSTTFRIYEIPHAYTRDTSFISTYSSGDSLASVVANVRAFFATDHRIYLVRDQGQDSGDVVYSWEIASNHTLVRGNNMLTRGTNAQNPSDADERVRAYLNADIGSVTGMAIYPDENEGVISVSKNGITTLYRLTVNANGTLTPKTTGSGNNVQPVTTTLSKAVSTLTGAPASTHQIIKGNASQLAYVYLLKEDINYLANGNVQYPDSDHSLSLYDGPDNSSRQILACTVSAARQSGYPRLNSVLNHKDTLHYAIRNKAGEREANGTEWLIGLWTEP